uniref:Uncharacterized protein n=1 Tax=Acrobeloides nanus TaxID=290746 RepID=A0A914C5J8_9BILA
MRFSISQARSALNSGDYEDALLNYMTVLRVASITRRPEHQIHILLMALCEIYKEDVAYLQRIADGLAIQGEYLSSATVFRKAIALSQSPECRCSPTERIGLLVNVDHINSLLFDAWHWQMLNSKIRNEAFANAICKAVERFSNPVILDIGCGSGILSIVSARTRKAKKIIACDYSETMCSISSKVGVLNDLNSLTDFELYPIHSCDLELQQRADILVSETVDSAIFGENILSTIQDAQDRLLKEDSIVIPSKHWNRLTLPLVALVNLATLLFFLPIVSLIIIWSRKSILVTLVLILPSLRMAITYCLS